MSKHGRKAPLARSDAGRISQISSVENFALASACFVSARDKFRLEDFCCLQLVANNYRDS